MNDQPDAFERAATPPGGNASADTPDQSEHRPFRSWALQQDLISLIGSESDWRGNHAELGIDPTPERNAHEVRGQRYLRESLEPDERFSLRAKTAAVLWAAVLISDALNQLGPVESRLSAETFLLTVIADLTMLVFSATIYPRLKPRAFAIAEQSMLIAAYVLTMYQASGTGGSESPYLVGFVFTIFYSAYLLPGRRSIINIAVAIALGLSTVFMTQTAGDSYTFLVLFTLALVSALLGGTLRHQRRIETAVERATQFLALADPLTGVANLRSFEKFSSEIDERGGDKFALAMVDMNGLKGANAVFGHEVGDGMILRMAKLLLRSSNPRSQVFRIGGDEFVVLMPGGDRDLAEWKERFDRLVVEHNARVRGRLPQISASIGTSISPLDGTDLDDLVEIADRRMFEQKSPAVQPPHELDGATSLGAGASLRLARFANVPQRTLEPQDIFGHAALNWLVVSALTLMTLTLSDDLITRWAVVAVGVFGLLNFALVIFSLQAGSRKPVLALIDVSTILFGGLSMLATGGSESPIQLAMMLPVAFYAQYLHGLQAIVRVALICGVYSIGFWAGGDVADSGVTLYVSILSAMLLLTAVLQYSSGSIARSLEIVRQSATLDPLTLAANVHAFQEDLAAAIERAASAGQQSRRPALVIADLDEFKNFNVTSGHRGGDRVLIAAVDRLRSEFGDEVKVYRIGGDEFALLFPVDRSVDAADVAVRCQRVLNFETRPSTKQKLNVSASIGLAVWSDPLTADSLVESAEAALAANKAERERPAQTTTNMLL